MDINDLRRDKLNDLPGKLWKRSVNGMRVHMYKLCIHTNGEPFLFADLPYDIKDMSYHRKAIGRGYIKKHKRVRVGHGLLYMWVIA